MDFGFRLYRDNGKEDGNYYSVLGKYRGETGIMEQKMETTIVQHLHVLCDEPRHQEQIGDIQ